MARRAAIGRRRWRSRAPACQRDHDASTTGAPAHRPRAGDIIEGRLARWVDLASGRFALLEKDREFTLVRLRPVLENQLGKTVHGIARGDGVTWQFGCSRGPEIS
ncbi:MULTISPECIES: DUF3363 domain-containing protein [unclassified Sphingomonas]|nr:MULTISPECIES: DUF3363 domain-containing protein [unclassified Sphingomonas]